MIGLYPIIRRKRQPLETATIPETPPLVTICPHCGRSSAATVQSVPDLRPSNLPLVVAETVQSVPEGPAVAAKPLVESVPPKTKAKKPKKSDAQDTSSNTAP
jgi:hypothetical protein